jgi:hypothetical protein
MEKEGKHVDEESDGRQTSTRGKQEGRENVKAKS